VIALNPEVLLLDEVTASLDPIATKRIEKLILLLSKKIPIIMVTHSLQQAVELSNYIAFLLEGKIIEYGKTKKVFLRPKDKRTENYITGRYENIIHDGQ
jgi:phosphate transport system ATP-binding protein